MAFPFQNGDGGDGEDCGGGDDDVHRWLHMGLFTQWPLHKKPA